MKSIRKWLYLLFILIMVAGLIGCLNQRRRSARGNRGGGGGGGTNKIVEKVAENRYSITTDNGETVSIPMMANQIPRGSEQIDRAIILIPAVGRQIGGFHTKVKRLAREEGAFNSTVIIGLQFLYGSDIKHHNLEDDVLYWGEHGWSMGDPSASEAGLPRTAHVSSFAMVDSLVTELIAEFPNLNTILVTGNSAGSKFTQRYAIGTRMPEMHPDVHFGFISSNGGTFLYMSPERPKTGTLNQWFTPNAADCERYNDYPLGLENLNEYQESNGGESIPDIYATRNYVYLIGSLDTRPDYNFCAYMVQGKHRLDRNKAYWNYLQYYYGPEITEHQHFHVIEGATHNGPTYDTRIGRHYLFEWVPGDPSTYDL